MEMNQVDPSVRQAAKDLAERINAIEALQYRAAMVEVALHAMAQVTTVQIGDGPCLDRRTADLSTQIIEALNALEEHLADRLDQARKEIS